MNVKKSSVLASAACAVALTLASVASTQANLLTNPGFETGDITGWTGNFASASTNYANSGTYSGLTDATAAGAWAVPELHQAGFAASPGQEFNLQGYGYGTGFADGSFGLLKIVFRDGGGVDLDGGTATIGTWVGPANPGAESSQINVANANLNAWTFLEVQAIAPAGTAEAVFLALNVNQASDSLFYWDDLSATLIPEPTTFALAGLGAAALLIFRRRS